MWGKAEFFSIDMNENFAVNNRSVTIRMEGKSHNESTAEAVSRPVHLAGIILPNGGKPEVYAIASIANRAERPLKQFAATGEWTRVKPDTLHSIALARTTARARVRSVFEDRFKTRKVVKKGEGEMTFQMERGRPVHDAVENAKVMLDFYGS